MQTINATINKILYQKDNGWGIYRTDKGVAKGVIPWTTKVGQIVNLTGDFQTSNFNGQQEFVFKQAFPSLPKDSRSLLAYAVSLCKGLGKAKERAIWEQYGEKWQEAETLNIPGVTAQTQWHWQDTLKRLASETLQTETYSWLLSKGCSMAMANAAWREWGEKAYGIVEADCFKLAELPRYGFQDVDRRVRGNFDIGDDDPRRIDAAILYVLRNRITDGSTFVVLSRLKTELATIVPGTDSLMDNSIKRLIEAERIVMTAGSDGERGFSVYEDAKHEERIFERFKF